MASAYVKAPKSFGEDRYMDKNDFSYSLTGKTYDAGKKPKM
jgi:hypothetical protein